MKKKKILSSVLTFCMLFSSFPVYAAPAPSEGVLTESSSNAVRRLADEHTHTYSADCVDFMWNDDYTCTAVFYCTECGESEEVEAEVTYRETEKATCTEDGTYTYTATASIGKVSAAGTTTAVSEASGHNFVYSSTQPADCENDGYDIYVCSKCGEVKHEKTSSALGHVYSPDEQTSDDGFRFAYALWSEDASSCTVYLKCTDCEIDFNPLREWLLEQREENPDYYINFETFASYVSKAFENGLAYGCDHIETVVADEEYIEREVTVQPVCEETGRVKASLALPVESREGEIILYDEYTGILPALGHDFSSENVTFTWNHDETSCIAVVTCDECGKEFSLPCEITREDSDISCTEDGTALHTAVASIDSRYGEVTFTDTLEKVIKGSRHEYDSDHVTFVWNDDYTCTAVFSCVDCGEETEVVCEVEKETLYPTCTEKGSRTYTATASYFKRSQNPNTDEPFTVSNVKTVETEALGHSFDNGFITTQPACLEKGVMTYTCTRCQYSYTEELEALGHDFNDGVITVEPSCTKEGVKTFTCTRCGSYYTESVEALGHSYESTVVSPSCLEEGYTIHTCSRCNASYTDSVTEKLGHSYDSGKVTVEPECKKEGVKTFTCTRCGSFYTESVEALGHIWNDGEVTRKPTGTQEGEKTFTCLRCAETRTEAVEPLGMASLNIKVTDKNGSYAVGVVFELYDEDGNFEGSYKQISSFITLDLAKEGHIVKIVEENGYTFENEEYSFTLEEDMEYIIKAENVKRTSSSGGSSSGGSSGGSSKKVFDPSTITAAVTACTWTYFEDLDMWTLNDFSYRNIWVYAYNPYAQEGQEAYDWFHFNSEGYMDTGWFTDTDGNVYYLNPSLDGTRGKMVTGWTLIDGKYYYFNPVSDGTRGAMYRSTVTPDGYTVDETGAWVQNFLL